MAYTDRVAVATDAFTAAADAVAAAADAVTAAADAVIQNHHERVGPAQTNIKPMQQTRHWGAPGTGRGNGKFPQAPNLVSFPEDTARQNGRWHTGIRRDAATGGPEAADDLTCIRSELTAIRQLLEKLVANNSEEIFAAKTAGGRG
jgi:hypothetical protein